MLTEKELVVLQLRARGESQKKIAKRLNISQAAVSKFESNAHKKILEAEELRKITKRLKVTIEKGLAGKRVRYGGEER